MIRQLDPFDRISTAHIGGFCPYWMRHEDNILVADTAGELADLVPADHRIIDPVSVLALLQFNYMLGDRTLVAGIHKMPPRAVLAGTGEVRRFAPIPHGMRREARSSVAARFLELLEAELVESARGHSRVHVLLSGGMDSRIIAGVLQRARSRIQATIDLVTWGDPQSRDVAYAKRVAAVLGWEHILLEYTPQLAWANVSAAASWGGAECTGIHLHGLEGLRELAEKDDLVVAGTLGDSMGRAVYSGRHIKRTLMWPITNTHGLLPYAQLRELGREARRARASAWGMAEAAQRWVRTELDMQENYLGRMLCHAMDYARQFCSLHQAFSSDALVEFVWSLLPEVRRDGVYSEVLRMLDPRLAEIPWARTGLAPDGWGTVDSTLRIPYHDWRNWPRKEFADDLQRLYFSSGLDSLGVFHRPALERLWKRFMREDCPSVRLNEDVLKICSIEIARNDLALQRPFSAPSRRARATERGIRAALGAATPASIGWRAAKHVARGLSGMSRRDVRSTHSTRTSR